MSMHSACHEGSVSGEGVGDLRSVLREESQEVGDDTGGGEGDVLSTQAGQRQY